MLKDEGGEKDLYAAPNQAGQPVNPAPAAPNQAAQPVNPAPVQQNPLQQIITQLQGMMPQNAAPQIPAAQNAPAQNPGQQNAAAPPQIGAQQNVIQQVITQLQGIAGNPGQQNIQNVLAAIIPQLQGLVQQQNAGAVGGQDTDKRKTSAIRRSVELKSEVAVTEFMDLMKDIKNGNIPLSD